MPLTTYTAGDVLTAQSLNDNFTFAADNPTAPAVAIFNETQASGTEGGTFTAGSFQKRTLNTTVVNQITGCTLTSSVISLPAGTYQVLATAPAIICNSHKTRLQNTTDATTIATGTSEFSSSTNSVQSISSFLTVFTLAATKNLELQHRCSITRASNGLGVACTFGVDEVYAQIQIVKIA